MWYKQTLELGVKQELSFGVRQSGFLTPSFLTPIRKYVICKTAALRV